MLMCLVLHSSASVVTFPIYTEGPFTLSVFNICSNVKISLIILLLVYFVDNQGKQRIFFLNKKVVSHGDFQRLITGMLYNVT